MAAAPPAHGTQVANSAAAGTRRAGRMAYRRDMGEQRECRDFLLGDDQQRSRALAEQVLRDLGFTLERLHDGTLAAVRGDRANTVLLGRLTGADVYLEFPVWFRDSRLDRRLVMRLVMQPTRWGSGGAYDGGSLELQAFDQITRVLRTVFRLDGVEIEWDDTVTTD